MGSQHQINSSTPYPWPHGADLSGETTALVLIDMQRDFCDEGGYFASLGYDTTAVRDIIPRLKLLLNAARKSGIQIYHTREGHRPDLSTLPSREAFRSERAGAKIGSPGPLGRFLIRGEPGQDTIPELKPEVGEPVIEKPMRSAFNHTDFDLLLRNKGIKNLIIGGVTTETCVLSTIKDAIDKGYDVVLLEDGAATPDTSIHEAIVKGIQLEGGIAGAVATTSQVLDVFRNLLLG